MRACAAVEGRPLNFLIFERRSESKHTNAQIRLIRFAPELFSPAHHTSQANNNIPLHYFTMKTLRVLFAFLAIVASSTFAQEVRNTVVVVVTVVVAPCVFLKSQCAHHLLLLFLLE